MELDNIKSRTTWNDASASINSNFMKVHQAILALQSEGGGLDEAQLEEYLLANGYTKGDWVLAQNALLEKRIENLEQESGAVNVEGSEFVNVDEDGTISLEIDPQGGLGATQQGLGIVDIPSRLLDDIKTKIDSEMSDTSENAVSNRVIKEYVDKTDAVLSERIAALELGGGGGGSGGGVVGEGDKYYYHTQAATAEEWVIEHNLGKFPAVTVVSSAGEEIFCDKRFVSINKVVLNFGTPVSGAAFLN